MRTFHIGGAASRAAAIDNVQVKTTGALKFTNLKTVAHSAGHLVAVSRSGELSVMDQHGRERERYRVPYGAVIDAKDGARSRPARRSRSGIRIRIRSFRKSPVWCASSTSSTASRSGADRRADRSGQRGRHGSEASRQRGQGPAPDGSPGRQEGRRIAPAGYGHSGAVLPAGRVRSSRCRMVPKSASATSSHVSRRKRRRPATSPAACRALRTCSRRASRRSRRSSRSVRA